MEKYPGLAVIGFPCNQFGHQENLNREEIYLSLKHVRPGNDFRPNFPLTKKIEVNGTNAHDIFKFLRLALPQPCDMDLVAEMENPVGGFRSQANILWSPISRSDVILTPISKFSQRP